MKKHYIGSFTISINSKQVEIHFNKRTVIADSTDTLYAFIKLYLEGIEDEAIDKKIDTTKTETYAAFNIFLLSLFSSQDLLLRDDSVEFIEIIMNRCNNIKPLPEISKEEESQIIEEDKFLHTHTKNI